MFQQNFSLKKYNTFGIEVFAKYFADFADKHTLQEAVDKISNLKKSTLKSLLILGGGSNILFTRNFEGWVLKNEIKGIDTVHEDEEYVYVKSGGGENWHRFVIHCIQYNLCGVENLSLIPGNVGASPMQNIGAYGVEIKDVFHSLEAFHLEEKKIYTFSLNDCKFGYRESVFKKKYKDQFAILDVTFRLRKRPTYNISYGAVEKELENMGVKELSIQAISQAIINIRQSKLPDPSFIGNAGSFFKNPEVQKQKFEILKSKYENIPGFQLDNGNIKLAAGWLIEHCGWKGYRKGDTGCYPKQALVLVNYGNASGKEIYELSKEIKQSVKEHFGVVLEREVSIF